MTHARPDAGPRVVRRPDGARLVVDVLGPEVPQATVVLAHGWTMTRTSWRPVVERLRRERPGVRVVTYDQRDHGDSWTPPRRFRERGVEASMAVLGEDLAAVLQEVAPAGPVVLGGHSMGGMSVLAFVGRHPAVVRERVEGVVLVNTAAAELSRRPVLAAVMRLLAAAPAWLRVPRVPAPLARRLGYGAEAPPDLVAQVREGVKAPRARSAGAWFRALMELDERESLRHLRGVSVTVIGGDTDRLTPFRHAEQIVEELPDARLELVSGTGHMLLFEHPDRVAASLLEHLPKP